MRCPNEQSQLEASHHVFSCTQCRGSFHKREGLGVEIFENLREMFRKRLVYTPKSCPECQTTMIEIEHREGELYIDICPSCHGIWFDSGELEHLHHYIGRRLSRHQRYLDSGAQAKENEVQALYKRYLELPEHYHSPSGKEILFQILSSLPLERNLRPVSTPKAVFTLLALNLMVFVVSLGAGLEGFLDHWAYIPGKSSIFPYAIYSMFLHGGVAHILGNMYFLWIMGDNVEDLMGIKNFLWIYFLAGLLGFIASGWSGPEGVPHVGASGAVAGIMAAYFMLFPKAKFLLRFFFVIVVPISSWVYIAFWFGMNLLNFFVLKQPGVAWSAHIIGFLVGLIGTYLFKKKHEIPASV